MTGLHEVCLRPLGAFFQKRDFRASPCNTKKLELPSWSESCSKAMQNRRNAIRKYVFVSSKENYIKFQKAHTSCLKKELSEKRKGWHSLNGFNRRISTSQIWALIKTFKRKASHNNCSSQN